jgi:hypothetical protein
MLQNEPFRHVKMPSLWPWQQQIVIIIIITHRITPVTVSIIIVGQMALQVQNTLNLLRASRINPNILAYEAFNGPYNCDCYPLAPPGYKAIIYEAPAVLGSWALQGTAAWYLVPSKDHCQCNLYYVPKTGAYPNSGLAELFPQHCQVQNLSNTAHLKALTKEFDRATTLLLKHTRGTHSFTS